MKQTGKKRKAPKTVIVIDDDDKRSTTSIHRLVYKNLEYVRINSLLNQCHAERLGRQNLDRSASKVKMNERSHVYTHRTTV